MKTMKFKYSIISIVLLTLPLSLFSMREASKNIHKEYNVKQGNSLVVENKFGDIDIYNWDKNQVSIDVTILVEHFNDEKAQKVLEYIKVDFYESENEIKAITSFSEGFDKITNSLFSIGTKEFSIDYKINMPEYLNINITNKYGNTFVSKVSGHANLNMKYGNIKIINMKRKKQEPMNRIELAYGNGTIDECSWLKLDIKYSNADIENSKSLSIESKYSKLNIGKTKTIIVNSKYDTYNIDEMNNLEVETEYSNYKIDKLNKIFKVNSKYTNIKIYNINNEFEEIDIDNKYGSIKLGIPVETSYKLNGEAKYCKIHYPENSDVSRIIENTQMEVHGVIGNNKNTNSKISINTKYGHVFLNE